MNLSDKERGPYLRRHPRKPVQNPVVQFHRVEDTPGVNGSKANKRRTARYNASLNRCRVSFTDTNGILLDIDVQAESLYEAVALAVAEFRAEGPMTEFVIAIHRPAVEHRIRLSQVTQWAKRTRDGPAGVIKRQRIMSLLK